MCWGHAETNIWKRYTRPYRIRLGVNYRKLGLRLIGSKYPSVIGRYGDALYRLGKENDGDYARYGSSEKERSEETESCVSATEAGTPLAFSAPDWSGTFSWNGTGASAPRRENPLWFLPGPSSRFLSGLRSPAAWRRRSSSCTVPFPACGASVSSRT